MLVQKFAPGLLLLVFLWLLFPCGAGADEFNLIPYLGLRGEYNDNLFFDSKDETDDLLTTVSGGLQLVEKTERLDLDLNARIDLLRYADNTDLDTEDQFYRGRVGFEISPNFSVKGNAAYTRDSRRDRDLEETGLVQSNITRKRQDYGAGATWTLDENTALIGGYRYQEDDFDDPEESDSRTHQFDLGLTRDLGRQWPGTIGRVNLGYARYDYSDLEVDDYSLTVGAWHGFTEKFSAQADVGGRYTRSEFQFFRLEPVIPPFVFRVVEVDDDSSNWGGVGSLVLSYAAESTVWNLRAFHELASASGRNGATERTAAILDVNHRLSQNLRFIASTGYYWNKGDAGELSLEDIDEETFRLAARLQYNLWRQLFVEGGYRFDRVEDQVDDDTSLRNVLFAGLRWELPLFE
jgi:predicted porin